MTEAVLDYSRNDGKRATVGVADQRLAPKHVAVQAMIQNARVGDERSLWTHGFELVHAPTGLSTAEFYSDATKVRDTYYKEIENIVHALTGATRVVAFHHLVRKSSGPSVGHVEKPASGVHCDYTVRSALQLYSKTHKPTERQGRYAVINAWRNIGENPIFDDHLAMCDARSVVAPDDFIIADVYDAKEGNVTEMYHLDAQHAKAHQWHYYPRMIKNELLIFMQYDSNPKAEARYTFHTAFSDLGCPPGSPPRESIELRLIAFFPHHQPDTIPDIVMSSDEKVNDALTKVMQSVKYPQFWPPPGVAWMKSELYLPGGPDRIINELVNGGRTRKEHGLDLLSPHQLEEVRRRFFVAKGEWEAVARKNFPKM